VSLLATVVLVLTAACTSSQAPQWSFVTAPSVAGTAQPASPAPSAAASASPVVTSQPASPVAPSPSPSGMAMASPSTSPAASASASTPPAGPPDPGQPGFVAGTAAKPRVIRIQVNDLLLFDPTVVSVQQGETIRFELTNIGQATHEFKIGPMKASFGDLSSAPEIAPINPGTTVSLTYTFSGTGPYAYACHAPGHFENGMFGFVDLVPTVPYVGTPSHPRMIVIRMDDQLEFVPSEVSAKPGETVLFVLPNVGSTATHDFQVGPADRVALNQADGQIVAQVENIEPYHVQYLQYTFGTVGPYAFADHYPGHYEAGMKGVVDLAP
jgi:uncharacterized cupredoxin-like copper-binding protein